MWILGNANILSKSGTIWAALVLDAKHRECLFNATENAALAKLVLKVKTELDQLVDLLNFDSAAFCNTKWEVRMHVTPDVSRLTWLMIFIT